MSDADSYLVNVSILRDLFQQEGRALPPTVGFIERAFPTPALTDTDIGTGTTPYLEQLVSLGLTWRNLRDAIYQVGRGNGVLEQGNGVLWMGQDTFLLSPYGYLYSRGILPQGFHHLLAVHTAQRSSGIRRGPEYDPPTFNLLLVSTNPTSDSCTCMMNILAEVIALDESITVVDLYRDEGGTIRHFPAAALERLITKSRSKRRLSFCNSLSSEQTRVLFNGSCNDKIELWADFTIFDDGGAALVDALRSNQCPVKVLLISMETMSDTRFVEFVEALSLNQSLKEIGFELQDLSDHRKCMLLGAVATNRGLHSLFSFDDIFLDNNNMLQLFWSLISQNTSLTRIDFRLNRTHAATNIVKVHRSNCIVNALKHNTTLTDITYSEDEHDPVIMQEVVLPMLELNRFRPRIQAIRKVPNDAVRWGLFGKALLHPQFQQFPCLLFRLLLVHSDDFGTLVKPTSEAENSIARRVKKRRRCLVASK